MPTYEFMYRIYDTLKVFIACGDSQYNKALAEFISCELNLEVIGISETHKDLIRNKKLHCANLILLDTSFPDNKCFDAVNHIFYHNHRQNIIALTSEDKPMCLESIILLGFKGVIVKDRACDEIESAIKMVVKGKMYFSIKVEKAFKRHTAKTK
ncbi:response regulator transcription factor [Bacteroidales bacterium M08MB]|nr:response regulator transcription factor [Perlabentimonas gracilis]